MGIALSVATCGAFTAFADPTNTTITVPADDNHTYAVYQIYTGELQGDVLSNVHYGKSAKNGREGDLVPKTELEAVAAIDGTDAEKAAAIAAYANLTAADYTVSKAAPLNVPTGYYLIKDNDVDALSAGDEATLYIVQVVGPTTIARKAGTVEAHKTIDDANDSNPTATADNGKNQTSSDYDIGDDVPYHLTATLSEKVEQYKKYHITFVDTLEAGKFDAISALDIKMNGAAIAATDDYTVTITGDGAATKNGFEVTIEWTAKDDKTLASLNNANVTIDFTAKLGEGANIGSAGNKNTFKLKYSNNPDTNDEGETPEEVVITFTYKVVVNKVDEENKPLPKAGFTLYKVSKADAEAEIPAANATNAATKNAYWATKALANSTWTDEAGDTKTSFSFNGLDDGYYVLCETTTPAGYNTIDPQVFKVEATHGGTDGLTLLTLTGDKVSGTIELTGNTTDGTLTATIQNNKGAVLPSTGGSGTTMLYIIGVILLAGAAILLVTKRRMNAE